MWADSHFSARSVTEAEAAHFRENDWVKLDGFISPDAAAEMRSRMQRRLDAELQARAKEPISRSDVERAYRKLKALSVDVTTGETDDEYFYRWSHSPSIGAAGAALLGAPVRFLVDVGLVKLGGDPDGGSLTPWHNDVGGRPNAPWQPGNSQVSIWIALTDVSPEKGSMRFVAPRYLNDDVRQIASTSSLDESYAEFERRGIICPPLSYKAGDASAHGSLVMHSAPPNLTGDDRFAYVTSMLTANAVYSGHRGYDYIDNAKGLEVGKPFVDTRFPVLA